jgi:P63C domain
MVTVMGKAPNKPSSEDFATKAAKKGGKARANVLTPEQRRAIARTAARSRWGKEEASEAPDTFESKGEIVGPTAPEMPYSVFRGTLKIGALEMECHVLSDGRRAFTQREMVRMLSGGRESGDLAGYLTANPLIDIDSIVGGVVKFKIPGNPTLASGYEATMLVEICDKYMEAESQRLLKSNQKKLALQSAIILRSCAKVGIIALIDEATGYQQFRAKRELQLKLQAFIADELQEWARMFPDEFWLELARLEGIHYSPRNRPLRWGKYVMMFVYDAIDSDVGKQLREKNPNPHFKTNHHQWLKQWGRQRVNDQIQRVITVMKLCDDMTDFRKKFAKVFKKTPLQFELRLNEGETS